jgi:hypothetical protein
VESNREPLQIAVVVKILNHGNNVQLLCKDAWGLLSVYLEPDTYALFKDVVHQAGLKIKGLKIEYDREVVRVTGKGKRWSLCFPQSRG